MTSIVILDGPYAGMTTLEYEAARAIDCKIARHLGWYPLDEQGQLWGSAADVKDGVFRDDPEGIPFYQSDANTAFPLLQYALKHWRYAAKQIFLFKLQKRAAETEIVEWPDCLIGLVPEFPKHICLAFLDAITTFAETGFDPTMPTERADEYARGVSTERFTETDENGIERERLKIAAPGGKPPWVH